MAVKNPLYAKIETEIAKLEGEDVLRSLSQIVHEGKYSYVQGRKLLNLSSNDYLGLSCDLDLQNDFFEKLNHSEFLMSSVSSRLLTGNHRAYWQLENLLAELYGTEAALVFSSGYHANSGILPAVCDKTCLVLADKLVHASIIDGLRLSDAVMLRFRHNDYEHLERLLSEKSADYSMVIIVTESIFSMDGDLADLKSLAALKNRYDNVFLYVDEAHAFGVAGDTGLGLAEATETINDIDFLVGTFGKAAASQGAFVVCSEAVRTYLVNKMRTLIYTTAQPPINVLWTEFVIRHFGQFEDRRNHLCRISQKLTEAVKAKGYDCLTESHIVPVTAGANAAALRLADAVQSAGFYVRALRPPTVPKGTARLRLSLTAALSADEIDHLIAAIPPKFAE